MTDVPTDAEKDLVATGAGLQVQGGTFMLVILILSFTSMGLGCFCGCLAAICTAMRS